MTTMLPEHILNTVRFERFPEAPKGGQQVGVPPRGVRLICEEYGFKAEVLYFRSQIQAREFLLTMLELYLQETHQI